MTDIVERVDEERWEKDGEPVTTYWVRLVNATGQRRVPCYDPRGKDLRLDAELPAGWEVKTSKRGKPYLAAPRLTSGGGGHRGAGPQTTAWRNTEVGAKYEQERMDRRTALMQALAGGWKDVGGITLIAEQLYEWLRKSVDGGGGQSNSPTHHEAAPPSSANLPASETAQTGETLPGSRAVSKRKANEPPQGWGGLND
jgi:hypothetical protein